MIRGCKDLQGPGKCALGRVRIDTGMGARPLMCLSQALGLFTPKCFMKNVQVNELS